jgi:hypothetical protein
MEFGSWRITTIMRTAKKYGLLLASTLLAAAPSYASSITGFTFTPDPSSQFNTSLSETFTSSEASVTGTVGCPSFTEARRSLIEGLCSGEVGTFSLDVDLTVPTLFTVDISGVLSGETAATGSVDILDLGDFPFSVKAGSFDDTVLSVTLPAYGPVDVLGSLDLTMVRGQEITLPLTMSVAGKSTAVPEPSGEALLIVGLLSFAGLIRNRFFKAA